MNFQNLQTQFNDYIDYLRRRFIRNLPFRMDLGRLGMLLAQAGRWLQVRYGQWNSEFRMKHEFPVCFTIDDSYVCTFHVSEMVTGEACLSFYGPKAQENKMPPVVKALFEIAGIAKIVVNPYRISIDKAGVFHWRELLPQIEEVILRNLAVKEAEAA